MASEALNPTQVTLICCWDTRDSNYRRCGAWYVGFVLGLCWRVAAGDDDDVFDVKGGCCKQVIPVRFRFHHRPTWLALALGFGQSKS